MTASAAPPTASPVAESPEDDKHERKGYQEWIEQLPDGAVKRAVAKLFTTEDSFQVHKILGVLSVISFVYRYFWVYPTTGSLGFQGRWIDHATIALHFLLSTSSIIFHVIARRIITRPMIIWEEYRLHAIVFSTRCLAVYLYAIFRPNQDTLCDRLMLPALVLSHHLAADYITQIHGPKDGSTTVRIKDSHGSEVTAILRLYSFYQFSALGSHLVPNPNLAELGFNTFIAIQSSAFLMTLYRKGFISYLAHGIWYTSCIVVSLFHIFRDCGNPLFFAKLAGIFILRTKFSINKYALWALYCAISYPTVEDAVRLALLQVAPSWMTMGALAR